MALVLFDNATTVSLFNIARVCQRFFRFVFARHPGMAKLRPAGESAVFTVPLLLGTPWFLQSISERQFLYLIAKHYAVNSRVVSTFRNVDHTVRRRFVHAVVQDRERGRLDKTRFTKFCVQSLPRLWLSAAPKQTHEIYRCRQVETERLDLLYVAVATLCPSVVRSVVLSERSDGAKQSNCFLAHPWVQLVHDTPDAAVSVAGLVDKHFREDDPFLRPSDESPLAVIRALGELALLLTTDLLYYCDAFWLSVRDARCSAADLADVLAQSPFTELWAREDVPFENIGRQFWSTDFLRKEALFLVGELAEKKAVLAQYIDEYAILWFHIQFAETEFLSIALATVTHCGSDPAQRNRVSPEVADTLARSVYAYDIHGLFQAPYATILADRGDCRSDALWQVLREALCSGDACDNVQVQFDVFLARSNWHLDLDKALLGSHYYMKKLAKLAKASGCGQKTLERHLEKLAAAATSRDD